MPNLYMPSAGEALVIGLFANAVLIAACVATFYLCSRFIPCCYRPQMGGLVMEDYVEIATDFVSEVPEEEEETKL